MADGSFSYVAILSNEKMHEKLITRGKKIHLSFIVLSENIVYLI